MSFEGEDKELTSLIGKAYDSAKGKVEFCTALLQHPAVVAKCGIDSHFAMGFASGANRYAPQTRVWAAKLLTSLGSEMLFFEDIPSITAFLNASIEKARNPDKPTPPKVLAKMVATRVRNALSHMKEQQEEIQKRRERTITWMKQNENNPGYTQQLDLWKKELDRLQDYPKPDLSIISREDLIAWVDACRKKTSYNSRPYVDLENMLARVDVTDQMVRMGCDLILVEEVMDS